MGDWYVIANIPEADYRKIIEFLAAQGYDATRIQTVAQRWE